MKTKTNVRFAWYFLIFVSGFALHAFLSKMGTSTPTSPKTDTSVLEETVQSLTDELASAQTENARLITELERKESTTPEVVSSSVEYRSAGVATSFQDHEQRISEMMSRQINQQLDIYAARLNLTDEQRNQFKEIMLLRSNQMTVHIGPNGKRLMERGPGSPVITQADIDDLAAEILTSDQLDKYNEMREQENASRSEMMATSQLSQIAPKLGLTEPQKDQVYAIYYNQAQQTSDGFIDPEQMRESQNRINEQIQEILTDEQRDVFKTIRENQNFGNFTIITSSGSQP